VPFVALSRRWLALSGSNARAQLKLKDVVIETLQSDRRDFAQRALEAEQQAAENTAEPIHDA
jgi:hypothetical protein